MFLHLLIHSDLILLADALMGIINSRRELTWFRDALIMFKLSSCVPDGTGAAGVQSFFQLLHDLWCAEKASHEWLSACAATSKKFKSPPFRPSSWLPAIVEMTFVGKLSDPDEPMRIRKSIEYFLDDEMLDDEMIRFLQDVLQRVSSFNNYHTYSRTRWHQLTEHCFPPPFTTVRGTCSSLLGTHRYSTLPSFAIWPTTS